MTLSAREVVVVLLFASIGLGAWWYRSAQRPESTPDTPRHGRPDYVVEQVAAVALSDLGQPVRRLHAPELRHYTGGAGSELDAPVLHLLETDEPDWVIRAERAWLSETGSEVLLEGRVLAERAAAADTPAIRVVTSELLVLDDLGYAETDRFVELERGEDWLTAANGAQLWFEKPMRNRFFGRVRQLIAVAPADDAPGTSSEGP